MSRSEYTEMDVEAAVHSHLLPQEVEDLRWSLNSRVTTQQLWHRCCQFKDSS